MKSLSLTVLICPFDSHVTHPISPALGVAALTSPATDLEMKRPQIHAGREGKREGEGVTVSSTSQQQN